MKILVVDDEVLARKSIIRSLSKLGYNDIYQGENGIEAFQIIQQIKPDIILADIRMPGMDGIDLLSKVKESIGDLIFIFISGYDFFEYAQKAVSLGAFNYLLKPVDIDNLKIVLDKAEQKIEQQTIQKNSNLKQRIKMDQGFEHMKRDFIFQLLTQKNLPDSFIYEKLDEFNICFLSILFCIIIISIDDYCILSSELAIKEIELTKFSIENISSEVLNDCKIQLLPFYTEDGLGYLLNFSEENPISNPQYLYEICCKIKSFINQFIHNSVTIGIGSFIHSIDCIHESFDIAVKSLSQRLIKGNNHVICFKESNSNSEVLEMITSQLEQEFKISFEQGNYKAAQKLLEHLYTQFKEVESINPSKLMKLNLQLIMLFSRLLTEIGISMERILGDEFNLYNEVNTCGNIDSIMNWFEHKLEICFEAITLKIKDGNKKVSDRVKEYISSSNNDITLEDAADYIHMNPSYFSRLFKQETGENFIDYLVKNKINKAKELLKTNSYKINEICKIAGFNDVKHFYKVFKRHTSYTPNEYRDIWFLDSQAKGNS